MRQYLIDIIHIAIRTSFFSVLMISCRFVQSVRQTVTFKFDLILSGKMEIAKFESCELSWLFENDLILHLR